MSNDDGRGCHGDGCRARRASATSSRPVVTSAKIPEYAGPTSVTGASAERCLDRRNTQATRSPSTRGLPRACPCRPSRAHRARERVRGGPVACARASRPQTRPCRHRRQPRADRLRARPAAAAGVPQPAAARGGHPRSDRRSVPATNSKLRPGPPCNRSTGTPHPLTQPSSVPATTFTVIALRAFTVDQTTTRTIPVQSCSGSGRWRSTA